MKQNTTYKQTELGLIPEDWEVKKLGDLGEFFKGKGVPKSNIVEEGKYKCLTYGDLYTKYDYVIQNVKSFLNEENILESQEIKYGDICIAGSGETLEDIGKCAVFIDDEIGYAGGDIIVFRSNENSLTLSYILNSDISKKQKYRLGQGHSVVHIYSSQLQNLKIPLPPLPEQKKIADCLSNWDSAIEKQSALINVLTQRKKALMQQLLTGKKRLPGFSEEWKEVKLGSLGKTYNGLTGKTKEDFGEGKPFITYMNIFSNPKINISNFEYVKMGVNENQNKAIYGDIFFTVSSETPNEVGMASVLLDEINDLYLNSFCFGFRLNDFKNLLPEFSSYLFRNDLFRKDVYKLAQGSTRFNLSKLELMKIKIKLPSLSEQTAIAEILTIADRELQLQKEKLVQLQTQKKGLMQVLLTGKKRLIN